MKKYATASLLLFLLPLLSACQAEGGKSLTLSTVYLATALLALALLIGCLLAVRTKRFWFVTLFSCVFVVNVGYALLSLSTSLETALWANRLSYLGSVFLPPAMLMILLKVGNTPYRPGLPKVLLLIALPVFLIAASPGILPIYYKEVSFAVIHGTPTLVKVYGPLHPLYWLYLLGYFSAMVVVILQARKKKTMENTSHSVVVAIAVFVNIGVWLMEQLTSLEFEMLSVSYLISELFLLGVYLLMNENQRLREFVKQVEVVQQEEQKAPDSLPPATQTVTQESIELFLSGFEQLTLTEKAVYHAHVARMTTKEILAKMNIKESTLKYHNRNLYGKLGVSSRKELLEIHKHLPPSKEKPQRDLPPSS